MIPASFSPLNRERYVTGKIDCQAQIKIFGVKDIHCGIIYIYIFTRDLRVFSIRSLIKKG